MALPIAAISAGVGIASKLFGGGKKRPDNRRAIAELRAAQPTGYITPQDLRAAELTRGRLTEGVNAAARQEGYEVGRRYQARGLAGSPAEERSRARLENERLVGQQHAGETAEEQLYNIRTGREAVQHQNELAIFGARVGETAREQERYQAENGAFWNSLNEFIPTILGGIGGGGGYASTPSGAYTPRAPAPGYEPESDTMMRRNFLRR